MKTIDPIYQEELRQAECKVKKLRAFYDNCLKYVIVCAFLVFVNWWTSPGYWWVKWVILGWGIGIVTQAISVYRFGLWGDKWEKRKVDEILNRK